MSKKTQTLYTCNTCDHQVNKWLGRCPECLTWNSFREEMIVSKGRMQFLSQEEEKTQSLAALNDENFSRLKSGITEFDRVVGGGLVSGSFILCAGEPGIGKSTLLLNLLCAYAKSLASEKMLYVSGEESTTQVGARAKRLGVKNENILILNEILWQTVEKTLNKHRPKVLIIDSIQTMISNEVESIPGSPTQMKEMAFQLMNYAKKNDVVCIIIGHITKEGSIAGPKLLEHIVDVVLTIEGESKSENRVLRCSKNRFGETHQVGLFEMSEQGLRCVDHLVSQNRNHNQNSIGCSFSLIKEGSRILALEVQALVVENKYSHGRRVSQGIDYNHLSMLVEIIEKYLGVNLASDDIYLNLSGGIKPQGRESDLAIIAAILSSKLNQVINAKTIFIGETSLTGSLKGITAINQRIDEIKAWGFDTIVMAQALKKEDFRNVDILCLKYVKDLDKVFNSITKELKDRAS